MQYVYYIPDNFDERYPVEVLEGTLERPTMIRTDDGKCYERVVLMPEQSGQRGQCDVCAFGFSNSLKKYCCPVHSCGPDRNYSVKGYVPDTDPVILGYTTEHIRWDRCDEPIDIKYSHGDIDIVEI